MDASSPMKPPNSHGTTDESSDSDSSFISFSSSDDIHDSFSSTSSDGPLYQMDSLRAHLPSNCKIPVGLLADWRGVAFGELQYHQLGLCISTLVIEKICLWDLILLDYLFVLHRRGLSKFFAGKSQSFTSLSDVKCLNDLVKPENPYRKKMKSCHSYGGLLNCQSYPPQHASRCIANNPHNPNSTYPNKPTFIPERPPVIPLTNT